MGGIQPKINQSTSASSSSSSSSQRTTRVDGRRCRRTRPRVYGRALSLTHRAHARTHAELCRTHGTANASETPPTPPTRRATRNRTARTDTNAFDFEFARAIQRRARDGCAARALDATTRRTDVDTLRRETTRVDANASEMSAPMVRMPDGRLIVRITTANATADATSATKDAID